MPAPTPDQEKLTKLVNRFRGISQYKSVTTVPMDHAQDLLNVMIGNAGYLEKFRVPVPISRSPLSVGGNILPSLDSLYMFTQGTGTRQLFFNGYNILGYFTDPENGLPLIPNLVGNDAKYFARTRYIESNNLLFGVNGKTVWKWDGTLLLPWGLPQPTAAPTVGWNVKIQTISQAANTITFTLDTTGFTNFFQTNAIANTAVGDVIALSGITGGGAVMNGVYVIASVPGLDQFTVTSSVVRAIGPFVTGTCTIYSTPSSNVQAGNTNFNITVISRLAGIVTFQMAGGVLLGSNIGELITISGGTGTAAQFNGQYKCLTAAQTSGFFNPPTWIQINSVSGSAPGGPDITIITPAGPPVAVGGFTNSVTPRTWRMSWAITATGEEGPASDISGPIPAGTAFNGVVSNRTSLFTIPAPPVGYGINSFFLYANLDGGGTWVTIKGPNPDSSWPTSNLVIDDSFDDSVLDTTFLANFINFPPPQNASFSTKFQGRIFLGGMSDAPSDIVYSGYDQIYRGRPETSFPPFNRIRLAIGADKLAGFGVLLNGVIAWDISNRMFMFSGTIQDITTTQPVQIADLLEEEPWQEGLSSADTIQSTPRGVVWVGSSMAVQIWNGIFYGEIIGPRDLSVNFYPYMRRITPSTRSLIQSAFINWLDRDWYVLNVAVDGSPTYNRLFFFDLSQEGADNLGIWVSDIACDSITVKVTSTGERTLVASIGGVINTLQTSSSTTGGIHKQISSTTSQLNAYWDSGYWQDQPHVTKLFRYGRLTTDQHGFGLLTTILDDESSSFSSPTQYSKPLSLTAGGRFTVNRKGRRQKFTIQFPSKDVDASVLELYTTAIPVAEI